MGEYGHWPQRQAALEAVATLAVQGDPVVVESVIERLADRDETCRQAACYTLGVVALSGDQRVVSLLVQRLEDCSWLVRDAAVASIQRVVTLANVTPLEELRYHSDEEVRQTIDRVLSEIVSQKLSPCVNGIAASASC